jgi:hypothetical protein
MAYYRLYFMDGLSGHVTSFIELEAASDSDAARLAESRRCHVAMELWCGRTKVRRWPPQCSEETPAA